MFALSTLYAMAYTVTVRDRLLDVYLEGCGMTGRSRQSVPTVSRSAVNEAVVSEFQQSLLPYKIVVTLCEEMCEALITAESGVELSELLGCIQMVKIRAMGIMEKLQSDEDVRLSTEALMGERSDG